MIGCLVEKWRGERSWSLGGPVKGGWHTCEVGREVRNCREEAPKNEGVGLKGGRRRGGRSTSHNSGNVTRKNGESPTPKRCLIASRNKVFTLQQQQELVVV